LPLLSIVVVLPNWKSLRTRLVTTLVIAALVSPVVFSVSSPVSALDNGRIPAGGVLRITVPEAIGGKTVVGQLTVDRVDAAGYVTAYGCDDDFPFDINGNVGRSDLNYDGTVSPVASNRLIVKADNNGDVCFFTLRAAAIIVDVNAVTFDTGINSFPNRRTDTRTGSSPLVAGGAVLRVPVPEAIGGKTVVGQLTVDRAQGAGFVTAYGCDDGIPTDPSGVNRSDLNYDSAVTSVASNRLIVKADADGDLCFYTLRPAALIVDINGVSDVGVSSFTNHRTDTRTGPNALVAGDDMLRVSVPEAVGGKTVLGQLTVDRVAGGGYVTAYGCDDGIPRDADGAVSRSDLNYDGAVTPVGSNRLIVKADNDGDVCFYTLRPAALVVDVNGVSDIGISSFPNYRIDTRSGILPPGSVTSVSVPIWPPYTTLPALNGIAALTGLPADATVTARPILAVKIDNYGVARPQWSLDQADAIIEENVEGISRFVALFQTRLPDVVGPVRSARTGDIDMLTAMNRPVFAFSGANPGVTDWIGSAARSEVLVDFSALHSPCYSRSPDRPGPHNLLLDPTCAIANAPTAGPSRPLWTIDAAYTPPAISTSDTTFSVAMDGVAIDWRWDQGSGTYLRSQDGLPHLALSGTQISARNVVELSTVYVPSPADARSPTPVTVGTGSAILHRNGKAILGTWSRGTAYDPYVFISTATGTPMKLNTGTTFIELERAP
jgi:Protein of unknown function (DUF3048) N-terminal domain/Protein of unknown function (DUF3048) C-terminal domain